MKKIKIRKARSVKLTSVGAPIYGYGCDVA